jgi:hypothetical protein
MLFLSIASGIRVVPLPSGGAPAPGGGGGGGPGRSAATVRPGGGSVGVGGQEPGLDPVGVSWKAPGGTIVPNPPAGDRSDAPARDTAPHAGAAFAPQPIEDRVWRELGMDQPTEQAFRLLWANLDKDLAEPIAPEL